MEGLNKSVLVKFADIDGQIISSDISIIDFFNGKLDSILAHKGLCLLMIEAKKQKTYDL